MLRSRVSHELISRFEGPILAYGLDSVNRDLIYQFALFGYFHGAGTPPAIISSSGFKLLGVSWEQSRTSSKSLDMLTVQLDVEIKLSWWRKTLTYRALIDKRLDRIRQVFAFASGVPHSFPSISFSLSKKPTVVLTKLEEKSRKCPVDLPIPPLEARARRDARQPLLSRILAHLTTLIKFSHSLKSDLRQNEKE
jgi:hypothetical protein